MGTALLGASSTEMMHDFPLHVSVQAMLSEVLRAGPEPTAGLSHLRTPESILMSCVASRGLVECVVSKNIRHRSQDDSDY